MKKKSLIAIVLVMLLVLSIFAFATETTETTSTLKIAAQTLSLEEDVRVNFYVSFSEDITPSEIKLLVWEGATENTDYTKATKDTAGAVTLSVADTREIDGTEYKLFQYCDLAAKEMGKTLYARAYYEVDANTIVYSDTLRYSVVQYLDSQYKKAEVENTNSTPTEYMNLLSSIRAYGAAAQAYYATKNESTGVSVSNELYTITVTGGTLADGFATGKFLNGASITLTGAEYFHCGTERLENNTVTVSADAEYVACTRESGSCNACGYIDATAMTADELKAAVAAQLATGETDLEVTLKPDAPAEMITAIRRAICDTEGIADGSIHLTLGGVTSIPGTTNWDGVAFGPGDIYDEAGKIVDQELVTQLASINLPDVTEIGAQAFYFCENLVSVSAPKAQTI
ncbi:MAG: hypothetical protein IJW76_05810, partial [Clostridia bacterium]|nr:hypothetical protein [Clostridia bacterium]